MEKKYLFNNKKIVIITHEMVWGVPHALKEYLLQKKVNELVFIGLPLLEQKYATVKLFKDGKLIFEKKVAKIIPGVLSNFVDFFFIFYWLILLRKKYDIVIGGDVLSGLAAILLKKIGIASKAIFYSLDFAPVRFKNKLLNILFHKVEKFDIKYADDLWNVSSRIAEGREKFLNISAKKYPQKVVNSGIWFNKIKQYPFKSVKRHQLLFLGHVLKKQGLQMVFESIPEVVKSIPDFKFVIMGGGEYELPLKRLANKLKIKKYILFKGWITDRKVIDTTLGESAAAIVVYVPDKKEKINFSYYGDPIKLKEYLASGLPVILTDVPHNAQDIDNKKCGIIVNYSKNDIANAIIKLLKNDSILREYKKNAVKYVRQYDWEIIFNKAFSYYL